MEQRPTKSLRPLSGTGARNASILLDAGEGRRGYFTEGVVQACEIRE